MMKNSNFHAKNQLLIFYHIFHIRKIGIFTQKLTFNFSCENLNIHDFCRQKKSILAQI